MSFSTDVKNELFQLIPKARHCRIAELAAAIRFIGEVTNTDTEKRIALQTENVTLAKKYYTMLKRTFNGNVMLNIRGQAGAGKMHQYKIVIRDPAVIDELLSYVMLEDDSRFRAEVLKKECCRRSFIRGAFLANGSMSNPGKSYHFEIVCRHETQADNLCRLICQYGISAKIIQRKNRFVVYIKESEGIIDVLNVMEAHKASMELENVRIIKEMRNSANRQFNCDAANINKMVQAATRQLEDIRLIQESVGLDNIPQPLQQMALVRLEYPDVSLQELGNYLDPPVGKSGVNHRLRKLAALADEIREKEA